MRPLSFSPDEVSRRLVAAEARADALAIENEELRRCLGLNRAVDLEAAFMRRWRLTPGEARFLRTLYNARGRAVSKAGVMDALYNQAPDEPDIRILVVFACKIRKKTFRGMIETVQALGYRITPEGMAACEACARGGQ